MKRIETNNFILTQSIVDSKGDSTWLVMKKSNSKIFYIHVFDVNHINIKLFNSNSIQDPSEAITELCNYIVAETGKIPYINIHYKNEALIVACRRAGFRKVKNIKHLYRFKVKN